MREPFLLIPSFMILLAFLENSFWRNNMLKIDCIMAYHFVSVCQRANKTFTFVMFPYISILIFSSRACKLCSSTAPKPAASLLGSAPHMGLSWWEYPALGTVSVCSASNQPFHSAAVLLLGRADCYWSL